MSQLMTLGLKDLKKHTSLTLLCTGWFQKYLFGKYPFLIYSFSVIMISAVATGIGIHAVSECAEASLEVDDDLVTQTNNVRHCRNKRVDFGHPKYH